MSALEVYGLVERIVGKENIAPHDSILEDVDDDWYMVALMTGKDDYHFIVFDHGDVYNKQGNTDFVKGCTIECILSTVWVSHFHEQEQIDQYAQALENPQLYTDGPVFFSIRRTWDEQQSSNSHTDTMSHITDSTKQFDCRGFGHDTRTILWLL